MSENKGTGLYAKMARVMSAIEPLAKDGVNSFFNYKFATDRAVYEAVREQLGNEGLAILTSMVDVTQMYDENGGKQKWRTMAKFEFTIADGASGETHTCVWWAEAADQSDKGVNKCATAALKYWLLKTFLIPTGDDPDADAPEKGAKSARRTVNAQTGEVTRSEAQPTTRGERSTHNPPKPSVADELPPAAQEQVAQELPLGTPRPEDVWVLSKTLYTKTAATMPKGVNWGFQVYEGAKKLGYADEEAVRAVVGVKSLNDWDKTLGELLNTLIDNAPTLAEAA